MLRVRKAEAIQRLAYRLAAQNDVRIYQYANSGTHLHLLLRAKTHQGFKRFLRTLSALVPRIVTGAKKGMPILGSRGAKSPARKFWDGLAYTCVVNWGRHFFNGRYYVIRNELEAEGLIPYRERKSRRAKQAPIRP